MAEFIESHSTDNEEITESVENTGMAASPSVAINTEDQGQTEDQGSRRAEHRDDMDRKVRKLQAKLREERARTSGELAAIENLRVEVLRADLRNKALRMANYEILRIIEAEKENIANWKLEVQDVLEECMHLEKKSKASQIRAKRLEKEMERVTLDDLIFTQLSGNAAPHPAPSTSETSQYEGASGGSKDDHATSHVTESHPTDGML